MSFTPSEIGVWSDAWLYYREANMTYFPPGTASYPTRKLCKFLAVAMLRDPDFLDFRKDDLDFVAYVLQEDLGNILTYNQMTNLLDDLYEWAVENGLPEEMKIPGQAERTEHFYRSLDFDPEASKLVGGLINHEPWWNWTYPQIDWGWIAGRIKAEVDKHGHRTERRACELERGAPMEQIEYHQDRYILDEPDQP